MRTPSGVHPRGHRLTTLTRNPEKQKKKKNKMKDPNRSTQARKKESNKPCSMCDSYKLLHPPLKKQKKNIPASERRWGEGIYRQRPRWCGTSQELYGAIYDSCSFKPWRTYRPPPKAGVISNTTPVASQQHRQNANDAMTVAAAATTTATPNPLSTAWTSPNQASPTAVYCSSDQLLQTNTST